VSDASGANDPDLLSPDEPGRSWQRSGGIGQLLTISSIQVRGDHDVQPGMSRRGETRRRRRRRPVSPTRAETGCGLLERCYDCGERREGDRETRLESSRRTISGKLVHVTTSRTCDISDMSFCRSHLAHGSWRLWPVGVSPRGQCLGEDLTGINK
jgi:hypothetical protein